MQEPSRRGSIQHYTTKERVPPTSCPNCGAGLPAPTFASDHHVTCDYCGSTVHFGVPAAPTPEPAPAPVPAWSEPLPPPAPSRDRGGPPLVTRIILLVISVLWAFPVGLIIGFVYLNKNTPGDKAFGKQVLIIVGLYLLLSCGVFGFLGAVGSTSGA